ncbi:hypothetical protein BGW80DRAFT_1253391 [Lactifluus volemus]|nr:hypothetical protein BGW80DRAFT_1253391 [Lactifluus volemus]
MDTHPTHESRRLPNVTDGPDPILDDKRLYSKCDNEDHYSPTVPPFQINKPSFGGREALVTPGPAILCQILYNDIGAPHAFDLVPSSRVQFLSACCSQTPVTKSSFRTMYYQRSKHTLHTITWRSKLIRVILFRFGRKMILPSPVDVDSKNGMETQAPWSSCPTSGLAFSLPLDNKSTESTAEDIRSSEDQDLVVQTGISSPNGKPSL